jgi:hypothetical protein
MSQLVFRVPVVNCPFVDPLNVEFYNGWEFGNFNHTWGLTKR